MKSIFPGLTIICGTVLIIAGNTTAGIVFAVLGFCGALAGAAIRHQQEQEETQYDLRSIINQSLPRRLNKQATDKHWEDTFKKVYTILHQNR